MSVTYTKLRSGDWGVKGPSGTVREGATVTVTKKSGESRQETVGRVVWIGDGVSIASIEQAGRRYSGGGGSGREYCGGVCPVRAVRCNAKNGPCHDCE